jgi:hypothetical protein
VLPARAVPTVTQAAGHVVRWVARWFTKGGNTHGRITTSGTGPPTPPAESIVPYGGPRRSAELDLHHSAKIG